MSISEELEWLAANMHEVSVDMNPHRANYNSVTQEIADRPDWFDDGWGDPADRAVAEKENRLFSVQVYPDTPIGFRVYHGSSLAETIYHAWASERAAREPKP